jgi:hypothetical protein
MIPSGPWSGICLVWSIEKLTLMSHAIRMKKKPMLRIIITMTTTISLVKTVKRTPKKSTFLTSKA